MHTKLSSLTAHPLSEYLQIVLDLLMESLRAPFEAKEYT